MSVLEQEELKETYYSEAMRYMNNTKEYLKNARMSYQL
jgi:thermostable 8-oxoguanine DNA glycosylase